MVIVPQELIRAERTEYTALAVSPDGTIYVGNQRGFITSFTPAEDSDSKYNQANIGKCGYGAVSHIVVGDECLLAWNCSIPWLLDLRTGKSRRLEDDRPIRGYRGELLTGGWRVPYGLSVGDSFSHGGDFYTLMHPLPDAEPWPA